MTSEYKIGRDLERLRRRVDVLEHLVEDTLEFDLRGETGSELAFLSVEKGEDKTRSLRWIRYTFGEQECHAMQHKGSWLKVWENGSWQSECTLKDRSRHSKWGNWVNFSVGGVELADPWAWLGNFGPGEEKVYTGRGSSSVLETQFDKLRKGKLGPVRHWRCWRR